MQQSGVLVVVPFLQLGILFHVSQCMHFFLLLKFKGTWKLSDLLWLSVSLWREIT